MLIATNVDSSATLAVPGMDYWASTAAHYYINPPGVSTQEGCVWGDGSKPIGNWSPYVAGANTDANGNTFVKLGWNPIYTGESVFQNDLPKFGVRITCESGVCNGDCAIDPRTVAVNTVSSGNGGTGAGGANFCVVTVPKGSQAKIETFDVGSTSSGPSNPPGVAPGPQPKKETAQAKPAPAKPEPTPEPEPEPTPEPTSEPTPEPTPTPTPTTSSVEEVKTTPTTLRKISTSSSATTSSYKTQMSVKPHVFFEQPDNSTDTNAAGKHGGGSGESHSDGDDDDSTDSRLGGAESVVNGGGSETTTTSAAAAATSSGAASSRAGSASSFLALAAAFAGCNFLL